MSQPKRSRADDPGPRPVSGTLPVPAALAAALRALGPEGDQWLARLPGLLASLEADWSVTAGAPMAGGNSAYVAAAVTADGTPAVLKAAMPPGIAGFSSFDQQLAALRLAGGAPYARLLRYDRPRRALLVERLGPALASLGWPAARQLDAMVRTAARGWRPAPGAELPTGAAKARWLAGYVAAAWEELGRPCPQAVPELAVRYAAQREAAFGPRRAVLVHGDVHAGNVLRAAGPGGGFRLIDPEGLISVPEHELGVIVRSAGLRAREPARALEIMTGRCRRAAALAGADPEAVFQWAFIERVSTGLLLLRLGHRADAERLLAGAGQLATALAR